MNYINYQHTHNQFHSFRYDTMTYTRLWRRLFSSRLQKKSGLFDTFMCKTDSLSYLNTTKLNKSWMCAFELWSAVRAFQMHRTDTFHCTLTTGSQRLCFFAHARFISVFSVSLNVLGQRFLDAMSDFILWRISDPGCFYPLSVLLRFMLIGLMKTLE